MKKMFVLSFVLATVFAQANESVISKVSNEMAKAKVEEPILGEDYNETTIFKSYNEEGTKGFRDLFYFVRPAKRRVRVGEPIQLSFKLKRPAYIYIIGVSRKDGEAYLLFPNNLESFNRCKAHLHYVMPERSAKYRLVSDCRGTETIYIIASTKRQNDEGLARILSGSKGLSEKDIEKGIKDIFIVPAKRRKTDVEVRRVRVRVR